MNVFIGLLVLTVNIDFFLNVLFRCLNLKIEILKLIIEKN